MPAYDATADSLIITEWAALNRRLAAGGDITLAKDYAATAEDGPLTVPEGVAVTLDLNGHILDRNLAAATNRGLVIDVRGSLAVTDGAPAATHTGALAGIPGGVITGGNSTDNGGGVQVYGSAATFTLSGGAVSGNTASTGGGVCVWIGTATLSGGTVSGNSASWGGGVRVNGGSFTMEGGAVSGNTASIGGGVYVNSGTATLSGGTVTGNTASSYGCGVYVQSGGSTHFQISGGPVVSGNAVGGAPNNVHLASGKSIDVVGELTASARLGVTAEAGLGVFTDGLGDKGDATNFFSDDPAWRVRLDDDSGEAELFEPVVLPAYLAGADTVVTNNYLAWAAKYGSDTNSAYESCFLLDLPPWTEIPEGASLVKIVEMGVTNIPTASDYGMIAMAMGYQGEELPCRRLVLASDVAQLKRREDFDTPFETCNGYLVLRIGADLSLPLDEWAAASWIVEFADGRGEFVFPEIFLEGIRGSLERAAGKPLGGLFLRPCISPVPRLEWLEDLGILVEDP